MPVLGGKRISERNPLHVGIVAILLIAAAILLATNSGAIYRSITARSYTAVFAEAGGMRSGDEVRVGGVALGKVSDVRLDGDRVVATFTVENGPRIGQDSRAAVKTATPLGTKFLDIQPAGPGEMEAGSEFPLERTLSAYDVQELLEKLTRTTEEIDINQLAGALDTVSDTFQDTPEPLANAVSGLGRLSETIATRDESLRELLAGANGVTGILAERSGQITTLMTDGNQLLEELYQRRADIQSLLANLTAVLNQLNGVVDDNREQIRPALDELNRAVGILAANQRSLGAVIEGLRTYATSLGEAIASGPWFYALVPNLVPTNLAQQTLPSLLDSATPPGLTAPAEGEQPR
ncbi:MCE family protein [Pseudonocardia sp. NPDC049154]|uniref:MCE family protein n=1 Tax=Pseudonocardia sp. NPDC049154 TaxID=3155501 RepID=UPI0033E92CC1